MDLGVLLARQHRGLLMSAWALVSLPVFALLSLLLWDHPSIALLLFWWLKPAFERLPLYILSRALFGDTPSLKQALKAWPRLLKPQLLASLSWRRLSLSRSFTLPVQQLEGLDGLARQQRLRVLLPQSLRAARWLTLIGVHLEYVLWIGLMALFYLLLPRQIDIDWHWQKLLFAAQHEWLWLEHLSNAFYALILILWEPVYIACGFSLYLNRRTVLEAWDIELVFRQLRQRLLPVVAALLLGVGLLSMPFAQPVMAAEPPAPDTPRLLKQPLTSQASKDAIKALLQAPPFKNPETVTRWRLGEPLDKARGKPSSGWLKALLERFDSRIAGHSPTGWRFCSGPCCSACWPGWLALSGRPADLRRPPEAPRPPHPERRAATVRPGTGRRDLARGYRRQRRDPLAPATARSHEPALSGPAQPPVA